MDFTISSDEALPIRGNFSVPADPRALVLIVHGFKGFKDWSFFPLLAESLCDAGFVACRFNMSHGGVGEDPEAFDRLDLFENDTYSKQLADLKRVAAYAHERYPFLPIFLVGHSRGGGVALLGANEIPLIRGVVTWNSISRVERWTPAETKEWRRKGYAEVVNSRTKQTMRVSTAVLDDVETNAERLDISAAVRRLRRPLLVIHGGADETVPVTESNVIAAAAADAAHLIIAGGSHTLNAIHPLVDVPYALSLAITVTCRFITAYSETRTIVME